MRFLRRNALGVYAVYAAAIVSGLVVTPVVIHSIGKDAFGIWSFIGSATIFLSLLDLGVGPSIVRFGAEARGRRRTDDVNEIASAGLALYGAITLVSLPIGLVLAWIVPVLVDAPDDLLWESRIATLLVVACIWRALSARPVQQPARRPAAVGSPEPGEPRLDGAVRGARRHAPAAWGGLVLLAALSLGATLLRLAIPLAWLRAELPALRIARRFATRARIRELASFSSSNFLVHIANKIVFSTDVIVVGIVLGAVASGVYAVPAKLFALAFGLGTAVTTLMYPAFAELEGAGASQRQRRLLLTGLRGGSALMLLLALPFILIPDLLIHAWIGDGYEDAYTVLALLGGVLLAHQPIYVLTQFLIARARQRQAALISIAATGTNLVVSVVLAWTVGLWGVAVSTLVTDAAALVLVIRVAAPIAGSTAGDLARASARPVLPAAAAAALVLVAAPRVWTPQTLLELVPLGAAWAVVATLAIWRYGLSTDERAQLARQLRGGRGSVAPEPV